MVNLIIPDWLAWKLYGDCINTVWRVIIFMIF